MMPVLSNHMHTILKSLALVALTATTVNLQAADAVTVDAKIPAYAVTSGVSGNLNSVGSDTLNNLMTFWSEGFKAQYPNVKIQVEGKGSGTAPVALASGVAQVGPMSREMKSTEIASFASKFGHKPTKIAVAIDALAVFVHKDNAIKGLSLKQVDGIFASTRKRGGQWSQWIKFRKQLGLKNNGRASQAIK
jgi:phosphate transport system substrate-binding protein